MAQPDATDDDSREYLAITRLQARYADVVNRRAWPELVALFEPAAIVRVDTVTAAAHEFVGPVALGDFIGGAIERFDFFEFVILNRVVAIEPGKSSATGRVFMCETRRDRASESFSVAFGVYHDHYRREDGPWRFAGRHYQSLARTEPPGVFPFPVAFDQFVPLVREEPEA